MTWSPVAILETAKRLGAHVAKTDLGWDIRLGDRVIEVQDENPEIAGAILLAFAAGLRVGAFRWPIAMSESDFAAIDKEISGAIAPLKRKEHG